MVTSPWGVRMVTAARESVSVDACGEGGNTTPSSGAPAGNAATAGGGARMSTTGEGFAVTVGGKGGVVGGGTVVMAPA